MAVIQQVQFRGDHPANVHSFLRPGMAWFERYETFKRLNSDIYLLVTPSRIALSVADAEVINQIVTRRNDFPKPTYMYRSIDIYGKNVITTEGSVWRQHRKITAPPFSETNNRLVWTESLHQAQAMMTNWVGKDGRGDRTVHTVDADAMRLSLHVISRAAFGRRVKWPHEEREESNAEKGGETDRPEVPPGHTMAYKEALQDLLEHVIWLVILPQWFLRNSPFKVHRRAHEALLEWGKYMNEIYTEKRAEVVNGETTGDRIDLMGALVRGAGFAEGDSLKEVSTEADAEKGILAGNKLLSDEEIIGNAFVFILAGHETTANTIHFSLVLLAMNPGAQRRLQKDVEEIFGERDISQWDYENDFPKLFGGMTGAVMNEALRLLPPVVGIPKSTVHGSPQSLNFQGRKVVVPEEAHIHLHAAAIHRNPKYWPRGPPKPHNAPASSPVAKSTISNPTLVSSTYKGNLVPLPTNASLSNQDASSSPETLEEDLDEFKPERWLLDASTTTSSSTAATATATADAPTEDFGGPQGRDTSASLFHPPKGAYIPFSDGGRACLGRRFAQAEVCAVLAVIFREWSVELAVDEWASDEEVAAMPVGGEERRRVWGKADARARWLLQDGMVMMITLQMRKGKVPVRFVRKGRERFAF
ncbi:MAG: hypothetical protein Q9165_003911 [Trypethelium subeluteriae]